MTRRPSPALIAVGLLTYVYIVWLGRGIARDVPTFDRAEWIGALPWILLLLAAGALLPWMLAGRLGPRRWMRWLYLAGGVANLWLGNFLGKISLAKGGSYWEGEIVGYLPAGVVFLTGFVLLLTVDHEKRAISRGPSSDDVAI